MKTFSRSIIFVFAVCLLAIAPLMAAPLNVIDFGAKGDDKADDTAAIQAAIDAACKKEGEVILPAGRFFVSKTLKIQQCALNISGVGSSDYSHLPTTTNLIWAGDEGGTMFQIIACEGVTIQKMNLYGLDPLGDQKKTRAGILILGTTIPGAGNTMNRITDVSFNFADVGIQFGTAIGDPTCSDYFFENVTFARLNSGLKCVNDQAVNFLFNFVFSLQCKTVFDMQRGGNLLVNNSQSTNCDLVLNIGGGGRNVGTYVFLNTRLESATGGNPDRGQLLRCYPMWKQAVVKFIGYNDCQWDWKNNKAAQDIPLCDIGPGSLVTFESSIFNSRLAKLTGEKTAPASMVTRDCSFGYIEPKDTVTANKFGNYQLVNSMSDTMVPYQDIRKWTTIKTRGYK